MIEMSVVYTLVYIPSSCKKVDLIWNKCGHANNDPSGNTFHIKACTFYCNIDLVNIFSL
jgi:hypothetical protein